MSWWKYIKALFKGKKVIEDAVASGLSAKEALSKSSWKSSEFWIAVLTGFGGIAAQAGGILPPPWGPVVLAVSGSVYAISRGLAKKDDPLGGVKPGVATTEFWITISASVASLLSALSGAVSPDTAATLILLSNAAQGLSRGLAKGGAQPTQ